MKEVIYGHRRIGFFKSQNWSLQQSKSLQISFIPPTYLYPTVVRAITNSGQNVIIDVHRGTSPVPQAFKEVKIEKVTGQLAHRFYLLGGALPRKYLHMSPSSVTPDPDFFRRNHHRFTYVMVINQFAEVVWIHVPILDGTLFSSYLSAKKVGDGYYGFMFGKHSGFFEIVKYTGEILRSFSSRDTQRPFVMHHDFETMGSRKLYAVGNEVRSLFKHTRKLPDQGKTYVTDTLIGIDLMNGRYEKLMSFNKYFHPGKTPFITGDPLDDKKFFLWGQPKADIDFLHINAVDYVKDRGVLVSFRNISKVGLVDEKFSKILWTLGGGAGDAYRVVRSRDRFQHQHTPFMPDDHTMVLFDNAITTRRSRVLRYKLDHEKGEARLTWQWQPKTPLFSKDRSSVYAINGGNLYGVYFVKPLLSHEKTASHPHRDIYFEVDSQGGGVTAQLEVVFPVASPGYRMIPISSLSDDPLFSSSELRGAELSSSRESPEIPL